MDKWYTSFLPRELSMATSTRVSTRNVSLCILCRAGGSSAGRPSARLRSRQEPTCGTWAWSGQRNSRVRRPLGFRGAIRLPPCLGGTHGAPHSGQYLRDGCPGGVVRQIHRLALSNIFSLNSIESVLIPIPMQKSMLIHPALCIKSKRSRSMSALPSQYH
jgi:hypothetical protein